MGGNLSTKTFSISNLEEIKISEEDKLREHRAMDTHYGKIREYIISNSKSRSAFQIEIIANQKINVFILNRRGKTINHFKPSNTIFNTTPLVRFQNQEVGNWTSALLSTIPFYNRLRFTVKSQEKFC